MMYYINGTAFQRTMDVLSETMKMKRQWNIIFRVLKKKLHRILLSVKASF